MKITTNQLKQIIREEVSKVRKLNEFGTRDVTSQLIDMMDEGALDPISLAKMCMEYMSEDEVADMARSNGLRVNF